MFLSRLANNLNLNLNILYAFSVYIDKATKATKATKVTNSVLSKRYLVLIFFIQYVESV